MSKDTRRGLIVALVFGGLIALYLLGNYFMGDRPTPQQVCTQKCAGIKRDGYLVYRGPATPKDAYKAANSECECR